MVPYHFQCYSDGCGEVEYCPECEPEWIECQYCDNIKICSRDCAHGSYKLDICEGEGCNRANCTDCFANNGSVEYVTQCLDLMDQVMAIMKPVILNSALIVGRKSWKQCNGGRNAVAFVWAVLDQHS